MKNGRVAVPDHDLGGAGGLMEKVVLIDADGVRPDDAADNLPNGRFQRKVPEHSRPAPHETDGRYRRAVRGSGHSIFPGIFQHPVHAPL